MKKNPIAAAVLNFFLFGAGTLYVGRRKEVGSFITVGGFVAQAAEIAMSPVGPHYQPEMWPFLIGGIVVMKLGLALDGYREAVQVSG